MEKQQELHFLTILIIAFSASMWAVMSSKIYLPLTWLFFLWGVEFFFIPGSISQPVRRVLKFGSTLLGISLLQIIFRRQGEVLLAVADFSVIFSVGLREAILMWLRFMILFTLAPLLARVSTFKFLHFCTRTGLSLNLSLVLLITLKLLPFIFFEAKRVLWFFRFRGLQFNALLKRDKLSAVKQQIYALLMRSVEYVSYSALALELRGYDQQKRIYIQIKYPLKVLDIFLIGLTALLNFQGLIF